MPILNVYVDDETMERLEFASGDMGASINWLAEAAISEAALRYETDNRPDLEPHHQNGGLDQ